MDMQAGGHLGLRFPTWKIQEKIRMYELSVTSVQHVDYECVQIVFCFGLQDNM